MSFSIVTYGGAEVLEKVFSAIVMIVSFQNSASFGGAMLHLVGVVGTVWSAILMYQRTSFQAGMYWFGWYLVMTVGMLVPTATVFIKDATMPGSVIRKVDNVPYLIAALAGTTSEVMHMLTKQVEKACGVPDDLSYSQTGSVFGARIIAKSKDFKIVDEEFSDNMDGFVHQCVVLPAMRGTMFTRKEVFHSPDVWALVSSKCSGVLGFHYRKKKPGSTDWEKNEIVTCHEGAKLLNKEWDKQIDLAAKYHGRRFFPSIQEEKAKQTFLQRLPLAYNRVSDYAKDAKKILQQEMMANAIKDGNNRKIRSFGGSLPMTKAMLQQKSLMLISGEMAAEILPMIKTVFECIAYATFIFVFVMAPLPGGHKLLGNYFREILWIQSWPVFYAIMNMMAVVWGEYSTMAAFDGEPLCMFNNVAISDASEGMKAIVGWLSLSVPYISRIIVTGGFEGFVHMASYMASTLQSSAGQAAAEMTSGNISLGNISIGNESYDNVSANKVDTSPLYRSAQFMQNRPDGTTQTAHKEKMVYTGGPGMNISTYGNEYGMDNQMGENFTNSHAKAISELESTSKEYSQAENRAYSSSQDFSNRFTQQFSKTYQDGTESSTSNSQSVKNVQSFTTALMKKTGMSQTEAVSVALSMGAGLSTDKIPLLKAHINGSLTGQMGRQASITEAEVQTLAKQYDICNSVDTAVKGYESLVRTESNSADITAVNNYRQSKDKLESTRGNYSKAEQKVKSTSESLNIFKSMSAHSRVALGDELRRFIQQKTDMSQSSAARIMSSTDCKDREIVEGCFKEFIKETKGFSEPASVIQDKQLEKEE